MVFLTWSYPKLGYLKQERLRTKWETVVKSQWTRLFNTWKWDYLFTLKNDQKTHCYLLDILPRVKEAVNKTTLKKQWKK